MTDTAGTGDLVLYIIQPTIYVTRHLQRSFFLVVMLLKHVSYKLEFYLSVVRLDSIKSTGVDSVALVSCSSPLYSTG